MTDLSIREILEQIGRGQIRIPAFQRKFVWEPERVAYLMDSIYKKYPFGSALFWRTKEKLRSDRQLGPFNLPEPQIDYPIDYVLDGQQRMTSIYGVFQSDTLPPAPSDEWLPIYFDLTAEHTVQESQFIALHPENVDLQKHFPLSCLFNTVAYRKANEGRPINIVEKIDKMQEIFKEAKIPVQTSDTQDKTTVAIIFERVNRQGIELDTLQLLSAWTWSEEFQLQEQFQELTEELAPFGFREVGNDTNLLLRCCSAILKSDASPQALMTINGSEVRAEFEKVTNGIKYAVDYMKGNFKTEKLENLPFTTLLVPLAVFFAVEGTKECNYTDSQRKIINEWFWKASFSRRYSSAVLRNLKTDIEQMKLLRDTGTSELAGFPANISPDFFLLHNFTISNVNTKTFILMLASNNPLSFISGQPVDLSKTLKEANRAEFHHLMPKSFLKSRRFNIISENALANFAFLSRADNRFIGGDAPSIYKQKMPHDFDDILSRSIVPQSLFLDDDITFFRERSKMLAEFAANLCGVEVSVSLFANMITSERINLLSSALE